MMPPPDTSTVSVTSVPTITGLWGDAEKDMISGPMLCPWANVVSIEDARKTVSNNILIMNTLLTFNFITSLVEYNNFILLLIKYEGIILLIIDTSHN